MKLAFLLALAFALPAHVANAQPKTPITPQAGRGQKLFIQSPKGVACVNCHAIAGIGTAVGPDLTRLAAYVGPRALELTIHMSTTVYVQEFKTSGGSFTGITKQKADGTYETKKDEITEIWDLTKDPPALRTLKAGDVSSMKQNERWKHPSADAGYSTQELADLIGFLKWASNGSQKEVTVSEVE